VVAAAAGSINVGVGYFFTGDSFSCGGNVCDTRPCCDQGSKSTEIAMFI